MGGNALKNTATRRYNRDEYIYLSKKMVGQLSELFPKSRLNVIPAYRSKPDFGDMDILIESNSLPPDWVDWVVSAFSPHEIVKNGSVLTFDVSELQIDLITAPADEYDFTLGYFSWNDLGNFMGRVAHGAGFSFGNQGLIYPVRDGNYLFKKIVVSLDFDAALSFLGYSPKKHRAGFDTLTDIFQYATSTPHFDKYSYDLQNISHAMRVRDKKRPVYQAFTRWLEQQPIHRQTMPCEQQQKVMDGIGVEQKCTINIEQQDTIDVEQQIVSQKRSHSDWLIAAYSCFPEFEYTHQKAINDLINKRKVGVRFNGARVSEITGLSGRELGYLMRDIKSSFETVDALNEFILSFETVDALNEFILSFTWDSSKKLG